MLYVSPFQELGLEVDGNLDKASLNLAKKRLLAELDLSEKPTILRGSMELTKNDIINQFDKLAAVKNWDFHRLIAADKALLEFLQHKYWKYWIINNSLKAEPQYNNEAFVEFVSPYFLISYKYLIIKSLTSENSEQLASVLKITPRLLTDDDHDDAWFSVESYLDGWKDNLNEMAERVQNGHVYNDSEVKPFYNAKFIECLNLLPDDFSWFRDSYATSLYNISAYTWNKENYYRAIDMVKYAQLLDVSDETDKMLRTRIAWFDEQMKTLGKSEGTDWGTIVRVVFFLIFFIFKVATCEDTTSNKNVNSHVKDNIVSNIPRISAQISTDSLLEKTVIQRSDKTGEVWTKARFDFIINMIKANQKVKSNSVTTNALLIEMSIHELYKIEDMTTIQRTLTTKQINALKKEFDVLRATNTH